MVFITLRHLCSWQHQSTSRRRWALKRLLMVFARHLGKKLLLPGLMHRLNTKILQREDCWTCLKVRWSFRVPNSWKSLRDILQDTAHSDWTVFEISCFIEKSSGYYGPEGLSSSLKSWQVTLRWNKLFIFLISLTTFMWITLPTCGNSLG